MKKIALLLLVFTTTGCASGKWAWEMTEADREHERRAAQRASQETELDPLLKWIGEILQGLSHSGW